MKRLIKICGLTNYEDAACAIESGAHCIGFIFASSPRQITLAAASRILAQLEQQGLLNGIETVGVFINETETRISSVLRSTAITTAQLHGDEEWYLANDYQFRWYKALRVSAIADVDAAFNADGCKFKSSRILVDTKVAGMYGGSGVSMEKEIAWYSRNRFIEAGKTFFLAGGINPQNVCRIIEEIQPDGIDISSGVEQSPGKKDHMKIRLLFQNLKSIGW
ncbi:MAG: phosphoribosylanthranilate isomerase [Chitinivibrionales bacterium]|nr:phosphoribosylanthranilate isomerase [Chitinivibrionales bacterium]